MTTLLLRLVKNHTQTHDPAVRAAYGKLAGIVGIICNIFLCGGKLLAGTLSGSVAVSADAINNLSDASSSVVTLLGFKLAEKPADEEHPYGHARIEYLAGLVVSAMVLLIGVELVKSSIGKILHPTEVDFSLLTLGILALSVLVKLWMAVFNRTLGKRIGSAALMATAADSRNDAISTGAVLLCCIIARISGFQIDGWVGLLVAIFILISGVGIARDTIDPLLGAAPDPELVQAIAREILSHDKVLGIHDLMVHDYGPGRRFASVHAEMDRNEDVMLCHDILDDIEREALERYNLHLVIHYDPVVTDDAELEHMKGVLAGVLQKIDPRLSFHDFRMVRGPGHTNLIFDVVVPFDSKNRLETLRKEIDAGVQAAEDHKYYTVITFD